MAHSWCTVTPISQEIDIIRAPSAGHFRYCLLSLLLMIDQTFYIFHVCSWRSQRNNQDRSKTVWHIHHKWAVCAMHCQTTQKPQEHPACSIKARSACCMSQMMLLTHHWAEYMGSHSVISGSLRGETGLLAAWQNSGTQHSGPYAKGEGMSHSLRLCVSPAHARWTDQNGGGWGGQAGWVGGVLLARPHTAR